MERIKVKVIFVVLKQLNQFQRKPRKIPEASTRSLRLFLGFLSNCLSCFTTMKITFTSILYPQFIYMIYSIYFYAYHFRKNGESRKKLKTAKVHVCSSEKSNLVAVEMLEILEDLQEKKVDIQGLSV